MFNFFYKLLDLIYKKKCYFCHKSNENSIFCSVCFDKIELIPTKSLKKFLETEVYACSLYAKEMQKLIRAVKYHNKKELAFYQAKIMWEYLMKLTLQNENYIIVPVPLHKKRFKKRKYNHMKLVADELSKLSGWGVEDNLIQRVKDTKPQYKLKIQEREENLKDAFSVHKERYKGENILIIDDILTTGSTFKEMIKEMQILNAPEIVALATSSVISGATVQY